MLRQCSRKINPRFYRRGIKNKPPFHRRGSFYIYTRKAPPDNQMVLPSESFIEHIISIEKNILDDLHLLYHTSSSFASEKAAGRGIPDAFSMQVLFKFFGRFNCRSIFRNYYITLCSYVQDQHVPVCLFSLVLSLRSYQLYRKCP